MITLPVSRFYTTFLACLLATGPLLAADSPELKSALQPLRDGIPEVAVTRLRDLLRGSLSEEEKTTATLRLSEALVASGQPAEALQLLQGTDLHPGPEGEFERAQALAALHRWAEALPAYRTLAASADESLKTQATWGMAESLRALDRNDEAAQVFTSLFPDPERGPSARLQAAELALEKSDVTRAKELLGEVKATHRRQENEKHFIEGRVALAEGQADSAATLFASILQMPDGVSHSLRLATLLAMADAHLQLKTPEAGDDYLEDFLDRQPGDPDAAAIFAKLDQLYRSEKKPSPNELNRWIQDAAQPRQALARWYLARSELRRGQRDLSEKELAALRDGAYKNPILAEPMLELAQMHLDDGQPDSALQALAAAQTENPAPEVLDRITMLTALTQSLAGQFATAAPLFEQVAQSNSTLAPTALFNAALCWLRLGRSDRYQAISKLFTQRFPDSELRTELILEQGLVQAAHGDKAAAASLRQFIHDFPQSPRLAEAWVALAELAYHASPPDLNASRQALRRASQAKPSPVASQRADYLAIWLEDAPLSSDDAKVIAGATRFLQEYPRSKLTPEVRLKLAETYFRRQDFPDAQTQFELLAQQNPGGPDAERALFFAGEAALASMSNEALDRAISLFEEVAHLGGEWKWAARNGQATAERKLGKEQDALLLYDEVLKNDAKPEVKWEALCGKGDTLYALGSNDPANYRRAIENFDQLVAMPKVSAHWSNQALFKKAKCLERLNDKSGALASCYQVLEASTRPDKPQERFWFYRAGFDAARLLEADNKWPSAVSIYRKLAASGGPRSDEAKARITRLRLEHFLWEE